MSTYIYIYIYRERERYNVCVTWRSVAQGRAGSLANASQPARTACNTARALCPSRRESRERGSGQRGAPNRNEAAQIPMG